MAQDSPVLEGRGDGQFTLSGDLVFEGVPELLVAGEAAFGKLPQADVDLTRIGRIDSAGLALLLEWSVAARAAGRAIRYRNLPPALSTLAGISDVSELLSATTSSGS